MSNNKPSDVQNVHYTILPMNLTILFTVPSVILHGGSPEHASFPTTTSKWTRIVNASQLLRNNGKGKDEDTVPLPKN
jgi:hypothetical protein